MKLAEWLDIAFSTLDVHLRRAESIGRAAEGRREMAV